MPTLTGMKMGKTIDLVKTQVSKKCERREMQGITKDTRSRVLHFDEVKMAPVAVVEAKAEAKAEAEAVAAAQEVVTKAPSRRQEASKEPFFDKNEGRRGRTEKSISRRKGERIELLQKKRYGNGGQKSKAAELARRAVADALMLMNAAESEGEAAPRACKALDATCSDVEFASESRQKRTPHFPLLELPEELQLLVAAHLVSSPRDRAALCVAVPPLGRKAIKEIPAYTGALMSLGKRVLSGGAVSEAEVRRYVREFAPSEAAHPSLALNEYAQLNAIAAPSARVRCVTEGSNLEWRLVSGALLRCWKPYEGVRNHRHTDRTPVMHYYKGAAGAERLVSVGPLAKGDVHEFEGERGAEQRLRKRCAAGVIWHYAPPLGLVRCEGPCGAVFIYDGEPRSRHLRTEMPSGMVAYLEGEKGAEHVVRKETPTGEVAYFKGEQGAEHLVRKELPCGDVGYFEGEKGAEHLVQKELPCGEVQYFNGDKGAEYMVQKELPCGEVQYFNGEKGAEYMVQKETPTSEVAYFEGEAVRLQGSTTYAKRMRSRISRQLDETGCTPHLSIKYRCAL